MHANSDGKKCKLLTEKEDADCARQQSGKFSAKIELEEENTVSKDDVIEAEGVIEEALPNATFKVKLSNGFVITAYISGKLRMNYIKIIPGDSVKIEMSPYDLTKGRIVWRSKN